MKIRIKPQPEHLIITIFGNHYAWGTQRDNFHVSPDYFNQTYWPFPFLAKWLLRTQRLRTTKGKDHQVLITIVWRNFESHSYLQIQLELSLTQIFFSSIINWDGLCTLGMEGVGGRWHEKQSCLTLVHMGPGVLSYLMCLQRSGIV